jgi:two-component system, cell cycle response regulator DivK
MARALIIEDDPDNQHVIATMLEMAGHDVKIAPNGAAGIDVAELWQPEIILMDMAMPVLDGWSATQQLRAHPQLAEIPILAVTSYAMPEDAQRAFEVGCSDYLSKPIDYFVLVAKVAELLAPAPQPGEES